MYDSDFPGRIVLDRKHYYNIWYLKNKLLKRVANFIIYNNALLLYLNV